MNNKRSATLVFFILSLAWMLFIWINSMQTGVSSGSMSGTVTRTINAFLRIFGEDVALPHLFIRKAAHFLEFSLLGLLLCFCSLNFFEIKSVSSFAHTSLVLLSLPASIAVALIDEMIQLFVDGRVGSIFDVMIDTAGAVSAILVFFAVLLIRKGLCKVK